MAAEDKNGSSAEVRALLRVGDRSLRIGSIRAGQFMLRDHCELPPRTEATLEVSVDGVVRSSLVILTNGISEQGQVVEYI